MPLCGVQSPGKAGFNPTSRLMGAYFYAVLFSFLTAKYCFEVNCFEGFATSQI